MGTCAKQDMEDQFSDVYVCCMYVPAFGSILILLSHFFPQLTARPSRLLPEEPSAALPKVPMSEDLSLDGCMV